MEEARWGESPHVFGLLTRNSTIGTLLAAIAVKPTRGRQVAQVFHLI
jgi:hypothetical protein